MFKGWNYHLQTSSSRSVPFDVTGRRLYKFVRFRVRVRVTIKEVCDHKGSIGQERGVSLNTKTIEASEASNFFVAPWLRTSLVAASRYLHDIFSKVKKTVTMQNDVLYIPL